MAQAAWIWWLGGGVLALAGLWLLWWSLFRDRARGRRRCPRCWYDMGGVPGLVCPECGRDARREKRLGRTRRKWRWAAIGGLVWIIAFSLVVTPRVRLYGPASLLPTSLLLWASPTIEQTWTTSDNEYLAWLEKHHDGMVIELSRRASTRDASIADWQWRYWIERRHVICAWRSEIDPSLVFVQVTTPPPLGSFDAVRISTAIPPFEERQLDDRSYGPLYPELESSNEGHLPPQGWTVGSAGATEGWTGYLGSMGYRLAGQPTAPGRATGPWQYMPTLSSQLWDASSRTLVLDVTYLRDRRRGAFFAPESDEQVILWSGRVLMEISEDSPPGFIEPMHLYY